MAHILSASDFPVWAHIGNIFSDFRDAATARLANLDSVSFWLIVVGLGVPFLVAPVWSWLTKGTKDYASIDDNMRVWTAFFVFMTFANVGVLFSAVTVFNSLGCYEESIEGCTSFDAIGISVTTIEIALVLAAFGGLWMVRSLTKEEAAKAAAAEVEPVIKKNASTIITADILIAALKDGAFVDILASKLDALRSFEESEDHVEKDFEENSEELIPENNDELSSIEPEQERRKWWKSWKF